MLNAPQISCGQNQEVDNVCTRSDAHLSEQILTETTILSCKFNNPPKYPSKIVEIPLIFISDTFLLFNIGSTYIHFYIFDKKIKEKLSICDSTIKKTNERANKVYHDSCRTICSIEIVFHSHYLVQLPDSAFFGVCVPEILDCNKINKRKSTCSNIKAFQDKNNNRIFIYFRYISDQNGSVEIIWVVQNYKYTGRVKYYNSD